jgi:hypothetical protein
MKLIWKKKLWWHEEQYDLLSGRKIRKLYIHPILAFASIIAAIPLTWLLCNLIAGI